MVTITLPDGNTLEFSQPITGAEIAQMIGPGLAKSALAMKINNNLCDLDQLVSDDAAVSIITSKDDDALEIFRHDAAHIMAEAVKELYSETQVTIGPAIENGFYYDFSRKVPFTPEDLNKIEKRMHEIVDRNEVVEREEWDRDKAISYFKSIGELYKAEIVKDLPDGEIISIYRQGKFIDLCKGPHLPSTGKLGHSFKLMKLAGAYWRGDSKNEMLQRIYGTAWSSKKELNKYINLLEEAEKRDHRRLGREMDLFHIQDTAVGSVFWHPKGWALYRTLESFIRGHLEKNNYYEVKTPQLVDRSLWEASGHWEKFREHMFTAESEEKTLALKPMNCPCHVQIFKLGIKSYRDLPIRMAEFGSCHRNEPSGALHGLMRVRAFTQDDAHIFCLEEQITEETRLFCDLLLKVYKDLGFEEVMVKFSDRPEVRAGEDEVWDKAETALKDAIREVGLKVQLNPGEGAFYGPKLEFVLRDAIGRDWQCGTLQVDFVLPKRLDATYIGEDGQKHRPVMLHRAILGSFERFIGILIEHYAGHFPLWLAPLQIIITTITNSSDNYAREVYKNLTKVGLRVDLDTRNEKINYKIREHSLAKVPIILVVGDKEQQDGTVAMRRLGGKNQEILALKELVDTLLHEIRAPV